MPFLTKEQIRKADDVQTEVVPVPEWSGDVLVRGMTGTQRDAFEGEITERRGKKVTYNLQNFRARLVALTVVDEKGERLFSDTDVEWLGGKSAAALARVFNKAAELSGISEGDIEDLTKNSPDDQSEGSGSGSA
jgi:hypothetical protein